MKYILYPSTSNTLIALTPSNSVELALKDIPLNTSYKIVDSVEHIDGTFFDAYEFDQELGAKINITKAKEIWKNKFRAVRKPILEKLDVEYMRALEIGDPQKQQEIATKKQALRDVTNTPLPNDLEGIKNTWPDVLNS
jgi:hypothetical protein